MANYLVTGSSRGLGLHLVAQLASLPDAEVGTIFATTRSGSSPGVQKLVEQFSSRVVHVQLDATDEHSARKAAAEVERILAGNGLDVLINNAGVMDYSPDGIHTMTGLNSSFNSNVTSAHIVTSAFLPLLRKGTQKKVANISSTLGSIGKAEIYRRFPVPAYKVSKAALNMLTVQYAQEYEDESFVFVTISPGWLQTDLGGSNADLPAETGAKAVLKIIHESSKKDNGKFLNIHVPGWEKNVGLNQYDGLNPPW
ncbi:hypothetical protein MMC17_006405 [Xylographa soralifera]|nr:hypothetical protein [Xylographa soralifera]